MASDGTPTSAFGTSTAVQVMILFVFILFSSPCSKGRITETQTNNLNDRQPRATYSRRMPSSAAEEDLYGFDCFSSPQETKVFAAGKGRRCQDAKSKGQLEVEHKVFDVLQYQLTQEVDLLSCSLELSRSEGNCGAFSHWSWDAPPSVAVPQKLSVRTCRQMHEERMFMWEGTKFPLALGSNSMSVIVTGSLRYDPKSASVTCSGNLAHLERGDQRTVEQALTMEHLTVTLRRERGKQLLQGTRSLLITSGSHHGTEWTSQEVARGGAQFDTVTFIVDESKLQPPKCPLAILKTKLKLTRVQKPGTQAGNMIDEEHANLTDSSQEVQAEIWSNSKIAIHQLQPVSLPPECGTASHFFKTNHHNILISPNTSPELLDKIKGNTLDYLTLSPLSEASRNDLVHTHVEELFANMSVQIEQLTCNQFYEKVRRDEPDHVEGQTFKVRYIEAGEVIFRLKCSRVDVSPAQPGLGDGKTCTKQLPVQIKRGRKGTGPIYYLEAVSRYLMTSSKTLPCDVHNLAPTVYESQAGHFVYFNGNETQYLKSKVREEIEMRDKYSPVQMYNLNADLDLEGLESDDQLEQSSLFLEYNRFLQVSERQDLAGAPTVEHARASGGTQAHSWWLAARATAGEIGQDALDLTGLSWATKVWAGIKSATGALEPMALMGGFTYFIIFSSSMLTKVVRFGCFLYGRPGESITRAIRLSVSGQSRMREDLDGQVQRLVRSEVTEMVDSELAGFRALMRQKEEVTSEV